MLIPDLVELCRAVGLPAMRIESAHELAPGLDRALAQRGPLLCEVRLNPNETLSPKVAALPQPDGSMLSMPLEDMSPLLPLAELEENMIVPLLDASRRARG